MKKILDRYRLSYSKLIIHQLMKSRITISPLSMFLQSSIRFHPIVGNPDICMSRGCENNPFVVPKFLSTLFMDIENDFVLENDEVGHTTWA